MNFIILASVIALGFFVAFNINSQKKTREQIDKEFWEREHLANSTRKVPLDNLNYITIPMETFPTNVLQDDTTIMECIDTLSDLSTKPIVNLTGYSNTELKLEYGTANITALTEFDQNYTSLVVTLQKWADVLIKAGLYDEAAIIMEFALSTETDVTRTYLELLEYYKLNSDDENIKHMMDIAEGLKSPSKKMILRQLKARL